MIRLNIIAEGQSEETFVNELLVDHLSSTNVFPVVQCVITSRDRTANRTCKGGLLAYQKLQDHVRTWLAQDKDPKARFTTMIDLYGLPSDFPKMDESQKIADPYKRVAFLQAAFAADIGDHRFIPYIQLHEFEALLLSMSKAFENYYIEHDREIMKLCEMTANFDSPELINYGHETAPSKRIEHHLAGYCRTKIAASKVVALAIGLKRMRDSCKHFNQWLSGLENLSK